MLKQIYSFFSFLPPFFPFKNSRFFPSKPGRFFFFSACFLCAHSSWLFFFFASCLFIVYSQLSPEKLPSSAMPDYPSFALPPHDSSRCSTPDSLPLSTIQPFTRANLSLLRLFQLLQILLILLRLAQQLVDVLASLRTQTCVHLLRSLQLAELNATIEVDEQAYFVITSFTEGVTLLTDSVSVSEIGVDLDLDLGSSTLARFSGTDSFLGFSRFCWVRFFFEASSAMRFFRNTSIFSRKRSRSSSSDLAPRNQLDTKRHTVGRRNRNSQTNRLINLLLELLFTLNDLFSHGFIIFGIESLLSLLLGTFL